MDTAIHLGAYVVITEITTGERKSTVPADTHESVTGWVIDVPADASKPLLVYTFWNAERVHTLREQVQIKSSLRFALSLGDLTLALRNHHGQRTATQRARLSFGFS